MSKRKHIIAILFVVLILASIGVIVPMSGVLDDHSQEASTELAADTLSVQDTTPLVQKLQDEMQVIQVGKSRKRKIPIWTLGKGRTIIVYLQQAQRFIQKNGGSVYYMEELHGIDGVFQAALLNFTDNKGDTLNLELQISENMFRSNASILAMGFQVSKLTPEYVVLLNELDFDYTLLIPPFGTADDFHDLLNRVQKKEVALWMIMESNRLNRSHNKYKPIRIHHTEQQIEETISEAKTLYPEAKGIATRFAEQAVEHRQLLQATFRPLATQKMWFLDLSNNKLSKTEESCKDFTIQCDKVSPYNPDNSALEDYAKQRLRDAQKNGLSAMVLPLNKESLEMAKVIQERAKKQGTNIINLSKFISF